MNAGVNKDKHDCGEVADGGGGSGNGDDEEPGQPDGEGVGLQIQIISRSGCDELLVGQYVVKLVGILCALAFPLWSLLAEPLCKYFLVL